MFSTPYFVFEILLILRVIVLKIPSKMRQLLKSGSEIHSIEKWHFLQCTYFSVYCKICFWVSLSPQISASLPVWPLSNFRLHHKYIIHLSKVQPFNQNMLVVVDGFQHLEDEFFTKALAFSSVWHQTFNLCRFDSIGLLLQFPRAIATYQHKSRLHGWELNSGHWPFNCELLFMDFS